jgi:hypothetical protein
MGAFSYIFDAFGTTLRIYGDWGPCLRDMTSWYAMPELEGPLKAGIELEISSAGPEALDSLMPLPGPEKRIKRGIMSLDRDFDYSVYADQDRQWTDYAGAGRILLDYAAGKAVSLICGDAMPPTYQKYLFSDHPLDRLLASQGIYSLHASCASFNGRGIAFTGSSGAGKSTAAFALLQKKIPVLTDEKLYVFKKGAYFAGSVSDIIKVRSDAISRFFPNPDTCRVYDTISDERYLKLRCSEPPVWLDRAPLKALCMLEQTGRPETEITPINPLKLIGGLFPVTLTGAGTRYRAEKFGFIMEMIGDIECRLIRFGSDMDRFAAAVSELAEQF